MRPHNFSIVALSDSGLFKRQAYEYFCTACGWDCEGYAEAIAKGETKDLTLCVPGEAETESMLKKLVGVA